MTTAMGPPPSRNPNPPSADSNAPVEPISSSSSPSPSPSPSPSSPPLLPPPEEDSMVIPMGPPPEEDSVVITMGSPSSEEDSMVIPIDPPPESENSASKEQPQPNSNNTNDAEPAERGAKETSEQSLSLVVPYSKPPWGGAPCHHFCLEILKDGCIIDKFDVYEKGAYMFGRVDLCDFVLEHPTISRFHAVLQFKRSGDAYIYDVGSTHGTFVNKNQVQKKTYVDLRVGDVIRFGQSTRLYILQGPSELMPLETGLKNTRNAKMCQEIRDREASLQRARREASLADGISWGMGEDAIEETEDDGDEVTWQIYKGQLTEKQLKTRDKVIKRLEKIGHMKKEIDVIRAKDISQGGLTQGQQTQIARNEQRMAQLAEELENLEETLNDSIRESIGARTGRIQHGNKKGAVEDGVEFLSDDDDEFYDRTKKKLPSKKGGENQSVETSDTLLDKKDAILKEIEENKELLEIEKSKMASGTTKDNEVGDALDAYMSGLSSQLVLDKTEKLQKELSALQTELDRISYLLKIADPTGEAAKKRDLKIAEPTGKAARKTDLKTELNSNKAITPAAAMKKQAFMEPKGCSGTGEANGIIQKESTKDTTVKLSHKSEAGEIFQDKAEGKTVYTVTKPQWLGAVGDRETEESSQQAAPLDMHDSGEFVDYKDRKKILADNNDAQVKLESEIENAAPGLIIRKRKEVHQCEESENGAYKETSSSTTAEFMAEDAVALLLKHKKGYYAPDVENNTESREFMRTHKPNKDKKPKRVLGPEKPSFLDGNTDSETWIPPEGQTGDGRTTLNDRLGY